MYIIIAVASLLSISLLITVYSVIKYVTEENKGWQGAKTLL